MRRSIEGLSRVATIYVALQCVSLALRIVLFCSLLGYAVFTAAQHGFFS